MLTRNAITRSLLFFLFGVMLIQFVGCTSGPSWARKSTRFEFGDLPEGKAYVMQAVFDAHGLTSERVEQQPVVFEVRGITEFKTLKSVLAEIQERARAHGISAPLETASLYFGQLEAMGSLLTTVTIRVSPGAKAWVADQDRKDSAWREVPVNADGEWTGPVQTSGVVAEQGGWLYILAYRDGVTKYSRVNVLTKQLQQNVGRPGFPEPRLESSSIFRR